MSRAHIYYYENLGDLDFFYIGIGEEIWKLLLITNYW